MLDIRLWDPSAPELRGRRVATPYKSRHPLVLFREALEHRPLAPPAEDHRVGDDHQEEHQPQRDGVAAHLLVGPEVAQEHQRGGEEEEAAGVAAGVDDVADQLADRAAVAGRQVALVASRCAGAGGPAVGRLLLAHPLVGLLAGLRRKSTRLNSSHANISYAVFCLKKKTKST